MNILSFYIMRTVFISVLGVMAILSGLYIIFTFNINIFQGKEIIRSPKDINQLDYLHISILPDELFIKIFH